MEMIQTQNVQLAMMMFFALMPMLGMLQARSDRNHPAGGGWGRTLPESSITDAC